MTPTLMSCRSAAAHHQRRFRLIGPPYSADRLLIFESGLPERKPFDPEKNISFVTLAPCMASFSNVASAEPLNTLLPLLVTRLMLRPPDCTDTSPPPVTTWICSNESKLKYAGEEFDERSVMAPPSRFHCTLACEP